MYAIIATGGKQYRVSEGDVIYIEKIDAQVDSTVSFDVLLMGNDGDVKIGTPVVEAVSYTHLEDGIHAVVAAYIEEIADVIAAQRVENRLINGLHPVSYTHLDVYKRQVPGALRDPS